MKPILVAFATTDGHTRKIAEHVAAAFRALGGQVDLIDAADAAASSVSPIYAAAVVAGSIHLGSYQATLRAFVKGNVDWLNACPAAFLSVSLSAALDDEASRAECRATAQQFLDDTGFAPGIVLQVAGALPYTQYDWFKRFAVKMIAKRRDGNTDTTRDFVYTDWAALTQFAGEFFAATNLDVGHS